MIFGFTGTEKGLTSNQIISLKLFIQQYRKKVTHVHHGDCVGADSSFHDIVRESNDRIRIIVHPPENDKLRAFKRGDIILDPKPYLRRNRDIVNACDILIATPYEYKEIVRSGTWSTVRYAEKKSLPIVLILSDGCTKFYRRYTIE